MKVYQVTSINLSTLAESESHDLVPDILEPNKLYRGYIAAMVGTIKSMNTERQSMFAIGMLEHAPALMPLDIDWQEAQGPKGEHLFTYATDPLTGTTYQLHECEVGE